MLNTCNKCGEEFDINFKYEIKSDIKATFFNCPYCCEKYYISFFSEDMNTLLEENRKLQLSMVGKPLKYIDELVEKINSNKKQLKEMNERNEHIYLNK